MPRTKSINPETHVILEGPQMIFKWKRSSWEEPQLTGATVDLPFEGWSMAMHPPSNVVAVSERTESVSNVPIHILAMDTGAPHDRAKSSVLSHDFGKRFSAILNPDVSISRTSVAVLFKTQPVGAADRQEVLPDTLVVWNWHTGEELYVLDNPSYDSMGFINDTWLLGGHYEYIVGENVYTLDVMDTSATPIKKISLILGEPSRKMKTFFCHWKLIPDEASSLCDDTPEGQPCYKFCRTSLEHLVRAELREENGKGMVTLAFLLSPSKLVNLVEEGLRNNQAMNHIFWRSWAHCLN